ncbi:hypothetical protein NKR19_g8180 [Coniochaeta hoffmannii]|uniref:Ubiquitin-like domain-containing protein n=1 Tax=Coniochaeta hoffmannii TaxID=91930 RepID=A0AA38RG82_9PEZI|nr:hypothetical protein NKR19_g8180 [Coniochaeta hoffmannii]
MADSATAAPPKKKLPFKRTVARRKSPDAASNGITKAKKEDDDDDGVDLFRRVEEELPQVLLEQERRIKKKEKRSSSSAAIKRDPDDQDVKRRKLSTDPDDKSHDDGSPDRGSVPRSASKPKVPASWLFDDVDIVMDVKGKGKDIFSRNDIFKTERTQPSSPAAKRITLDSDDDDVRVVSSPNPPRSGSYGGPRTRSQRLADPEDVGEISPDPFASSAPAVNERTDDDSDDSDDLQIVEAPPEADDDLDDEFAEYVQRARERAEREEKLKLERESQGKDGGKANSSGHADVEAGDGLHAGGRESSADDVIVEIFVTSRIPGLQGMVFTRRWNQSFGPVRDVWASRQTPRLPREQWPLYFFTWKGNRIYGTTTCANLSLTIEGTHKNGKARLVDKSASLYRDSGLQDGGLHLEVWTEDLYQADLKRKEIERLIRLGQYDDGDDDGTPGTGARDSEDPEGGGEEEATTRVILKAAKDYEVLKMKVHANTTIDQMIGIFRDKREVPEDKEISLFFDGEKLDGDMAVKDTEVEDMDSLEVHIK